jgi:hemerythrin
VSAPSSVVDVAPEKSTEFPVNTGGFSGKSVEIMRRQLVDAQVEVLRMYLEKRSQEQLLDAMDRLIECTRASFREEEALMDCFAPDPDPVHREMHGRVLARLMALRNSALDFDRGRLLAQLIFIDRELTSHISDVAPIPECH